MQFRCIDMLSLAYHDTAIYCTIQSSVNSLENYKQLLAH